MHPITLRIPNDLLSEIESEADELGYSSRAEYIRQLLQNRTHARNALSTDDTTPVVDPEVVNSNTEQIEAIKTDLETMLERVEELEQTIEDRTPTSDSKTVESHTTAAASNADTHSNPSSTSITDLETWLEEHGPQSDNAVKIIKEAATILKEDGPLKAGELKQRLYEAYPDAYDSESTLWGSTVDRVYEDAPGFSKPSYGTYAFG